MLQLVVIVADGIDSFQAFVFIENITIIQFRELIAGFLLLPENAWKPSSCWLSGLRPRLSHRFSCVFGDFQFRTRRAQLSLSAISWQSAICSSACTRCPHCPLSKSDFVRPAFFFSFFFWIGLTGGVAVLASREHLPPLFLFPPEGQTSWSIVCCSLPQCAFGAGAPHSAVINTNATCQREAGWPQNRSSPGRKSLLWTENKLINEGDVSTVYI